MKAMRIEHVCAMSSRALRQVELSVPEPEGRQVLIRIRASAVCRTDLHIIEGELKAAMPVVPGHQAAGLVERCGPECRLYRGGERVGAAWLGSTCGACDFCCSGRENLCSLARYTGCHFDGGYAEYMLADEEFVHPLPPNFADVEAAPLLCAGIIGFCALKRTGIKHAQRLAIFGFGSSAHITLQAALRRGCEVFVYSRSEKHLALAERLGASWTGSIADECPAPADAAIVFAPAGEVVPPALRALKKGGTCALAGVYMSDIPQMDYERHLFHEKTLVSVEANTRADAREFLQEAAEARIRVETEVYSLDEANMALLRLKEGRVNGTAVFAFPGA